MSHRQSCSSYSNWLKRFVSLTLSRCDHTHTHTHLHHTHTHLHHTHTHTHTVQEAREWQLAKEKAEEELGDLSDAVEMTTLDKEMAEERVRSSHL